MKTLILDNYDSFTFNLYQEIGRLGGNPIVERNDALSIHDVRRLNLTHIVISAGPGNPYTQRDIGISEELIRFARERGMPLLGVCLGHQILGKYFGAQVTRAPSAFHGKASRIHLTKESKLFAGIADGFEAMRYHSLCVEPQTIPSHLHVTAMTDDGVVMAMEHEVFPFYGVQFHPESIGTPSGKCILSNFLSLSSTSNQRTMNSSLDNLLEILFSETTHEDHRKEAFDAFVRIPITPTVLYRAATILRARMIPVNLRGRALDTCGTGGSGKKTLNTSTLTAFLVAACGGRVAKHGNRSSTGNCGSFDLLEHLGVNILLLPDEEERIFSALGIAFLFAPLHHPALRLVASLRKQHGKKTMFNLLGPLCNPASACRQLLGVGNVEEARILSDTLALLGSEKSFVVSGMDGLDEVSPCAPTLVHEIPSGYTSYFLPSDVGLPASDSSHIEGGTPLENVEIFLALAQGGGTEPQRRLALLNAAHGVLLAGLCTTLSDAYALARDTLLAGSVRDLFLRYRTLSNAPL